MAKQKNLTKANIDHADETGGGQATGEHGGIGGLFGRVAKRLQPQRLGPEKHLQNQKAEVQRGDQRHQDIGDPDHAAFPRGRKSGLR